MQSFRRYRTCLHACLGPSRPSRAEPLFARQSKAPFPGHQHRGQCIQPRADREADDAKSDAFIADEHIRPGHDASDIVFSLATERAIDTVGVHSCGHVGPHRRLPAVRWEHCRSRATGPSKPSTNSNHGSTCMNRLRSAALPRCQPRRGRRSFALNWHDRILLSNRQRPGTLIVHLWLGLAALSVLQPRASFQSGANPHHERRPRLDAMGSKGCPQLPPPLFGEGAGMAHGFAAAIGSTGAKRDAQLERLSVVSDVIDGQGIILVGASFGASVPSEQVNPSGTDAGLKGCAFVHESSADSAFVWIKDLEGRTFVRTVVAPSSGYTKSAYGRASMLPHPTAQAQRAAGPSPSSAPQARPLPHRAPSAASSRPPAPAGTSR